MRSVAPEMPTPMVRRPVNKMSEIAGENMLIKKETAVMMIKDVTGGKNTRTKKFSKLSTSAIIRLSRSPDLKSVIPAGALGSITLYNHTRMFASTLNDVE